MMKMDLKKKSKKMKKSKSWPWFRRRSSNFSRWTKFPPRGEPVYQKRDIPNHMRIWKIFRFYWLFFRFIAFIVYLWNVRGNLFKSSRRIAIHNFVTWNSGENADVRKISKTNSISWISFRNRKKSRKSRFEWEFFADSCWIDRKNCKYEISVKRTFSRNAKSV